MYLDLKKIHQRPALFSRYTADKLWTDPHLSAQMLKYHLNQETDLASRKMGIIDQTVGWIETKAGLSGKKLIDLGCGPGLYAQRFHERGAIVTGIDFSESSTHFAKETARLNNAAIEYRTDNYLEAELPGNADLIVMIYCDICVLSPTQRKHLIGKVRRSLKPGGVFIFDVMSLKAFNEQQEKVDHGHCFMNNFWAKGDYFGFQNTFKYEDEKVVLDQYTIVEPHQTWQVFNWMQYFCMDDLRVELSNSGFTHTRVEAPEFLQTQGAKGLQHFVMAQL